MIQDIAPHQFHNEYHPHAPHQDDYVLSYQGEELILKKDRTFFQYHEVIGEHHYDYLFAVDDISFFLTDLSDQADTMRLSFREMRTYGPDWLGFAGITGWQIDQWMKENKYCGVCGEEMHPDESERAMHCPKCSHLVYPKIMPAVIVGVTNEKGQILLTRYAHNHYKKFALVAGFAEIGETIEETVKREVKEETNLEVSQLSFYKSQPWSFSSTLLFGFWAHADSSQTIAMDDGELKEAAWYDADVNVDNLDEASLTAEMIRTFKKGMK